MRYVLLLVVAGAVGCSRPAPPAHLRAAPLEIPAGPAGDQIRLGRQIFLATPKYAGAFVGDQLSCNDCHLQEGTRAFSAPMIGLTGVFPEYNQRAGRVLSIQERIQDCFRRSENGTPPPAGSAPMTALVAYIQWLSRAQPRGVRYPGRGLVKLPALEGDPHRGAALFTEKCAPCHGQDGAGKPPILPALWGPDSYNTGAGMHRVGKMAAFIQHNMPQNDPGTLTAQQAYDVAAYVHTKPHTDYVAQR